MNPDRGHQYLWALVVLLAVYWAMSGRMHYELRSVIFVGLCVGGLIVGLIEEAERR